MDTPDQEPVSSESPSDVKQCCARLYESDFAKVLLGDSFHPGGLVLTERLGHLLALGPTSLVLDVASGVGTSAFFLAEHFGCEVVGVDYSDRNIERAREAAASKGLSSRVRFERGDAEHLDFRVASFDAVICECAFCTFPDKSAAALEFLRVLRDYGRIGISDLTRGATLPKEFDSLLAWISCIADAQTVESYAECLKSAGFTMKHAEGHDEALLEMVHQIQGRLLVAEVSLALKKIDLPGADFASAKQMTNAAISAIKCRELGYCLFIGEKTPS